MSELSYSRAIVMGDDIERVRALVDRLKTPGGYKIPVDPAHPVADYYPTVNRPDDGTLEKPARTTLHRLRRGRGGGLPPVRLKWRSSQRFAVTTLTQWCEAGDCGKCSARALRQIAKDSEAGFAGQLKWHRDRGALDRMHARGR